MLPDTSGMKNEFIIQRPLRDFKYDRSMTVAGGKLVEVGCEKKGCTLGELEAVINEKTAGVHYMAHGTTGNFASKDASIVPIEDVIELAHSHGLPVLVDAAFQCYPRDGFTRYTKKDVDLVAYSCKYFGGPNTAGILLGKKELVETVALHSFVGQEGGPGGQLFLSAMPDRMHGSVFRGYKMDRSSIVGAVASLEEHLKTDYEAIFKTARAKAAVMVESWEKIPGVKTKLLDIGMTPEEPGRISLHIVLDRSPIEIDGIVKDLMQANPPIWTSHEGNALVVNITSFRGLMLSEQKDTETIIDTISRVLQ
jgi:L-seryl-tRNA(Ser) seleniumtransferase